MRVCVKMDTLAGYWYRDIPFVVPVGTRVIAFEPEKGSGLDFDYEDLVVDSIELNFDMQVVICHVEMKDSFADAMQYDKSLAEWFLRGIKKSGWIKEERKNPFPPEQPTA